MLNHDLQTLMYRLKDAENESSKISKEIARGRAIIGIIIYYLIKEHPDALHRNCNMLDNEKNWYDILMNMSRNQEFPIAHVEVMFQLHGQIILSETANYLATRTTSYILPTNFFQDRHDTIDEIGIHCCLGLCNHLINFESELNGKNASSSFAP